MTGGPDGLEGVGHLYAALRKVNQAIVRCRTRETLLASVCQALVCEGQFGMVWIGWRDPATERIVPVATAGDDDGYLQSAHIYADDRPEGRGPSGIAFRSHRPYVCNDLLADPVTMPWREELIRRGFHSSAVVPILDAGVPVGVLNVYADRPNFFQEAEVGLLGEAAADLAFALDALRAGEEKRRAQADVERLVAFVQSAEDAIISYSLSGEVTTWNPAAETMFGYPAAEVLGRSMDVILPADKRPEWVDVLARLVRGEHVRQLETTRCRRDGSEFPAAVTFSPIRGVDHQGVRAAAIVGVSAIIRDATEQHATKAATEREQRLSQDIIEALPGVFYFYDGRGHFLRWNRNFETVSGYSGDEIARLHPLAFFPPDEQAQVADAIARVFSAGAGSVEASFQAKDGTTTPYFFTGRRVEIAGTPALLGVGVDIGERKRAEHALKKSEERFRSTLDTMLEGCQILGFDWRYLYLNAAAALQNRRPNHELLGQRMPEVWPGIEGTPVFALLSRCMETRVPVGEELEFQFADGGSGWFDIRAQPVPEGLFVLSNDVTERHRAVAQLHAVNEHLENQVAGRTRELEIARDRAEGADRLKSAFLATMSHELRTPLNSIIGFTGILLQSLPGPLNEEQRRQLGMVQGSARHLLELINDVLDISKIEAGQLVVQAGPFDLGASVERLVATVRPLAEKKGLALRLEAPPRLGMLEGDRRRVEQILLNLLNNAIKFTDRGEVALRVELRDEPPAGRCVVRLQVADTGIGIAPEKLADLFQPFRQLDVGLERQHEGTGLGLAICRRLATLLGGTVAVESKPGQGSVFTAAIPMRREGGA